MVTRVGPHDGLGALARERGLARPDHAPTLVLGSGLQTRETRVCGLSLQLRDFLTAAGAETRGTQTPGHWSAADPALPVGRPGLRSVGREHRRSGRAQSVAGARQLVASTQMRSGSRAGADAEGGTGWSPCLPVAPSSRLPARPGPGRRGGASQ